LWYSYRCPASLECSLAGVLGERIVSARKRRVRPPRPAKVRRCEEPGDPRGRLGGLLSKGAGGFPPPLLSGRVEPRACRAGSSKSRETRRVSAEKSKRLRSRSVEREKEGARFGFVRAFGAAISLVLKRC